MSERYAKDRYFFDIETRTKIQDGPLVFWVGSVYRPDDGRVWEFYDELAMFRFLANLQNAQLFAHNGGGFDFLWYMQCVDSLRHAHIKSPWYRFILSGSKYIMIENIAQDVVFIDTMNVLRGSLRSLCETFLGEDLKGHFDENMPDAECMEYCVNDTIILARVWEAFEESMERFHVEPGVTAASTAMRVFKRMLEERHGPGNIPCYRDNHVGNKSPHHHWGERYCRPSYFGGRVSLFVQPGRVIDTGVEMFDVNSMYPAMMSKFEMPLGLDPKAIVNPGARDGLFQVGDFYSVTVNVPDSVHVGPFPKKLRTGLYFPSGRFRTLLSGAELRGDNERFVEKVHTHFSFAKTRLFSDYVEELYAMRIEARKNGDDAMQATLKIMLNSLYGKFATSPEKTDYYVGSRPPKKFKFRGETGDVLKQPFGDNLHLFSESYSDLYREGNVMIAATITSLARRHLYNALVKIPPGKLYYCDTDSLHCAPGYGHLLNPVTVKEGNLGEWMHEFSGDEGVYLAPKMYKVDKVDKETGETTNSKKAHKGFSAFPIVYDRESPHYAEDDEGKPLMTSPGKAGMVAGKTFLKQGQFRGKLMKRTVRGGKPKRVYDTDPSSPWNIDEIPEIVQQRYTERYNK